MDQPMPESRGQPETPAGSRIMLVGSTGMGKSTTGNVLLMDWSDPASAPSPDSGPFKVGNGPSAETAGIQQAVNAATGWTVVDTPGLGDVPKELPGEGAAAYKARARQNSTDYFTSITRDLRDNGGLILVVQRADKLVNRTRRHLQAINKIVHGCMASSTVLVLTGGILHTFAYKSKATEEHKRENMEKYEQYLEEWRQTYEEAVGCRFFAVRGIIHIRDKPKLDPTHPGHAKQLVAFLQTQCLRGSPPAVYLQPGIIATDWQQLVQGHYDRAFRVEELMKAEEAEHRIIKGVKMLTSHRGLSSGLSLSNYYWITRVMERQNDAEKRRAALQRQREALLAMSEHQSAEDIRRYARELERLVYDD